MSLDVETGVGGVGRAMSALVFYGLKGLTRRWARPTKKNAVEASLHVFKAQLPPRNLHIA